MSINQNIAELIAEAKKLAKEEEDVEQPETSDSAKDDSEKDDSEKVTEAKKRKLAKESDEEEDSSEKEKVTEAKKRKLAKESDEESDENDSSDDRQEDDDDDDDEEDEDAEDEKERDMQEHIKALTAGENLTEQFKQKAATIFEAAVLSRVKQEIAKLDEAYEAKLNERVEEVKEGLTDNINDYLGYVVEQWMQQNALALENGMKSEILEGFIGGLKSLFERHYIDVPQERFDALKSLDEQNGALRKKLDEQTKSVVELKTKLTAMQIQKVINEQSVGLVETDKEKFISLLEELNFESEESFVKKAKTIRESYFTNKVHTSTVSAVVTDNSIHLNEGNHVPSQMKGYLSILDNLK